MPIFSAPQAASAGHQSFDGVWLTVSEQSIPAAARRTNIHGPYAVLRLNKAALDARLARAAGEDARARPDAVIALPLPDGRFGRFQLEASPILAPELAAAFPEIKTYRGAGLDDRSASARLDWTNDGFHVIVLSADGTVYIDPYVTGNLVLYVSYRKADLSGPSLILNEAR